MRSEADVPLHQPEPVLEGEGFVGCTHPGHCLPKDESVGFDMTWLSFETLSAGIGTAPRVGDVLREVARVAIPVRATSDMELKGIHGFWNRRWTKNSRPNCLRKTCAEAL